jgi:hypothetical protein
MEEIVDTLSCIVGIEPPAQHRILRGDPDRATTGMAVITIAGRNSDRALEVSLRNILVAIERNQGRGTDRHRIGAERQRLCDIRAIADTARINERDLAGLADIIQRLAAIPGMPVSSVAMCGPAPVEPSIPSM